MPLNAVYPAQTTYDPAGWLAGAGQRPATMKGLSLGRAPQGGVVPDWLRTPRATPPQCGCPDPDGNWYTWISWSEEPEINRSPVGVDAATPGSWTPSAVGPVSRNA